MSSADDTRAAGHRLIAERGWAVFLVRVTHDGKKVPYANCRDCPSHGVDHDAEACDHLLCHGFYAATKDHDRFTAMCHAQPDGALAVRTGLASGIVVLDAEATADASGASGVDTVEHWDELFDWSLPRTLTQRTQSGGLHLIYAYPPNVRVRSHNRVLPNVDLKAEPGYVVVPPAPGRSWVDERVPVAAANAELVAWLSTVRGHGSRARVDDAADASGGTRPTGYDFQRFMVEGAPVGCRDEFFNELAYRLRKQGATREVAEGRMRDAWERADKTSGPACPLDDALEKVRRVWETVLPDVETALLTAPPVDLDDAPDAATGAPRANGLGPATVAREPRVENATDLGNTLRLVRLVGDQLRFTADEGQWYVWDGARWVPDMMGLRALELTKRVVDDLYATTDGVVGDDRARREWARWANTSESITRRKAMLEGATAEPEIRTTVAAFDRDPWLLVTRTGTLDLRACVLTGDCVARPPRREDMCARLAAVDHDPGAPAPRWHGHVNFLVQGDPIRAAYLRRIAGYSLTGDVSQQAFFFLEGSGANGKNAFIEPLVELLGDYAMTGTSALLTGGDEQHPTILADLVGMRLVFIDEPRQGRALNVERVKGLTGSKRVKARRMRRDFFEFDARVKLWIAGNDHPTVRDPSDGVWRRMHRIMCYGKVPEDRKIADFAALLYAEEASGILNWAVEGLRDYVALGGLDKPMGVDEAVAEYRDEQDYVGQFLDECVVATGDPADVMTSNALYAAFTMWCALAGVAGQDKPVRVHFARRVSGYYGTKVGRFNHRVDGAMTRGFVGLRPVGRTG